MFPIKHFASPGTHYGHKANEWNPKTASFLSAIEKKNRIHIIDLEQSILMLRRALNFIREICEKRGSILCPNIVRETDSNKGFDPPFLALSSSSDRDAFRKKTGTIGRPEGGPRFQSETRLPSATTKGPTFLPSATGSRETLGSKQRRRTARLYLRSRNRKNQMSGKSSNRREKISALAPQVTEDLVPRALLIFNLNQNAILVKGAIKLQLPIIAVLDNKSDPSGIQFPIPGNCSSANPESLELYISCVLNAIRSGKRGEMRNINLPSDRGGSPR